MAVDPVTGAVLGWLVGQVSTAGKSGLIRLIRGDKQLDALRQIVRDAVQTATKNIADGPVLREALLLEAPGRPQADPAEVLDLRTALAWQVHPALETLAEQGYIFDGEPLTDALVGEVMAGIQVDAVRSGPLAPLAEFLRHEQQLDVLRGIKGGIDRLSGARDVGASPGRGLEGGDPPNEAVTGRRDALERARGADTAGPAWGVRVTDANPRLLGLHRAIEVPGAHGELPTYVARDIDDDAEGIRASISDAAEDGGFVVLVGESSVGKTRSLYNAVLDLMPDWWLLQPERVDQLDALNGENLRRVIIWLDDLQRFLGGATGLTGGSARRLLQAGQVVLVGTMWPAHHRRYTAAATSEGAESYLVERDLLAMAQVVHVPEHFSGAELDRARELARIDVRIRAALEISDYGFTQVIAAAPQLMDCWRNADPYARALLTAAIDAVLAGVRSPLPLDLLRSAAPAYCRGRARAEADPDWFEAALTYATTKLHGAMSLLIPVPAPPGDMGQIAGYEVADYLLQQTAMRRADAPIPTELWAACLDHVTDPADLTRLGESAESRQTYQQADRFYRTAAADQPRAAYRLARLLAAEKRDDEALEVLLPWAATPDTELAEFAAVLLGRTGRAEDLRSRTEAGDSAAAAELVNLLVSVGRERELRASSDSGNKAIAYRLADALADRQRTDEAVEVLQPHVSSGDWDAASQLADLLLAVERMDAALDVLRDYARQGHHDATSRLADLLTRLGHETELRARADAGDWPAAVRLADLLASSGREAELMARADAGDRPAAYRLAYSLREEGREAELRARADKGDKPALYQLSDLLAATERHDRAIELLRPYAEAGDESAVSRLISLLNRSGGE